MGTCPYKEIVHAIDGLSIIECSLDHRDRSNGSLLLDCQVNPLPGLCVGKRNQYPIDALWIGIECEYGLAGEILGRIDDEPIRSYRDDQIMLVELIGRQK